MITKLRYVKMNVNDPGRLTVGKEYVAIAFFPNFKVIVIDDNGDLYQSPTDILTNWELSSVTSESGEKIYP
jgi:hypothetical protein